MNYQLSHVENTQIQIIKYLDAGSFSQVFLCQTPTNLAVLKITSSQQHMKSIAKELEILRALKRSKSDYLSQFLVGFYAGESTPQHACLLLEFCKMNLVQYMNSMLPSHIPITTVLHILYDLVHALYFLHANGIIHRDVKLENVLIKDQMQPSNSYTATYCLCDLGSCTTKSIPYNSMPSDMEAVKYEIEQQTTMQYRAPELIDLHLKMGINYKVDVWALGCLLFKLLYYRNPFENEYSILSYNNNITGLLMQTSKSIPPQIKTILEKTLWMDPARRWSTWQVLNQLCELKGSPCPLQNIFQEETQSRESYAADTSHHPLIRAAQLSQQGIVNSQVGMSDLAQQRRANRQRAAPTDMSTMLGSSDLSQSAGSSLPQSMAPSMAPTMAPSMAPSMAPTGLEAFPSIEQLDAPYQNPPQQPNPGTSFPDLDVFEASQGQRRTSLKHFAIPDDPAILLQNVIKSVDLEDISVLLKWSWQRYHAKTDPIAAVLAQVRILMGQIGVTTTNVRGAFRSCLVIHSLLLYGPQNVAKQPNLENVLQALESFQNRMSSFYARYLRELSTLLQKYEMSGRYRGTKSKSPIALARSILGHIQVHTDKFLNMREAMGMNSDIGLCLFLFVQDAVAAIAAASDLIKSEYTLQALVKQALAKLTELVDGTLAYLNGLKMDLPLAYQRLLLVKSSLATTMHIPEPNEGELDLNEDLQRFWWVFE